MVTAWSRGPAMGVVERTGVEVGATRVGDGCAVGTEVGAMVGADVGALVAASVGPAVGALVGWGAAAPLGPGWVPVPHAASRNGATSSQRESPVEMRIAPILLVPP
jgi:hypothetical protein